MSAGSTQSTAEELQVIDGFSSGDQVGRYRLIAPLASGGMAHVWTAEPDAGSGLGRSVAIKIIRKELASEKEYARMFVDEATIASAIEHPNVCQLYELEKHGGTLFMAMEWVPGDSLTGMLKQDREFVPLEFGLAARICADACAGLHAAHEALGEDGEPLGVIHRDVSPPNILISLQGQVKVSDFGIAKARRQLHERTKTGEVKGKFGYLAPEQITGSKGDRRIDVYAMGCVLYIATVGLRPFGNGPKAMTKILKGTYRRPSEVDVMYPPGLEAIILKALAQRPEDRYASADEMRAALENWLVEAKLVVTQQDIAGALLSRMNPAKLASVKRLRKKARKAAGFNELLDAFDENEPPTAASGIVVPPGDLLKRSQSIPPADYPVESDDYGDRTVKTEVDVMRPREIDDQSGWHKTGDHQLSDLDTTAREDATETEVNAAPPFSDPPAPKKKAQSSGSGGLLLQATVAGLIVVALAWWLLKL